MHSTVDYVGIDSVAKAIDQSDLHKFSIYRQDEGKGAVPVFSCHGTTQTSKCKQSFISWANNMLQNNPYNGQGYKMSLFKDTNSEDGETSTKRSEMNHFTFALAPSQYNGIGNQIPGQTTGISSEEVRSIIDGTLRDIADAKEKSELLKKLEDIEAKLKEKEEEEKVGDDKSDKSSDFSINDTLKNVRGIIREIRILKQEKAAFDSAGDDDDGDDEGIPNPDAEDVEYTEVKDDEPSINEDVLTDPDDEDEEDFEESDYGDEEEEEDDIDAELDDHGEDEEMTQSDLESEDTKAIVKKTKQVYSDDGQEEKKKRILEKKKKRIGQALRILAQRDPYIDVHLYKLARISKHMPKLFKKLMKQLDQI